MKYKLNKICIIYVCFFTLTILSNLILKLIIGMEFLRNLFGAENKLPTGGKSAAEFLEYNGELINQVVRDIVDPFLNPSTATNTTSSENETDLSYTLKLMDADTCGQMAFYLSKNMSEMIKTYDISGFGGPINTIAPGSKSITEANIQTPTGMVSRKQICERLAGHYVTIINLIGAILTGINPQTNMALARMNSLYTLADGTPDTFIVNICSKEGNQTVKSSLLDEPGVKEFMDLYLFHLLSVSESPADKDRVMREYQNLVSKLVDEDRVVAMPAEIPQSVNMEVNNQVTEPELQQTDDNLVTAGPAPVQASTSNELQQDTQKPTPLGIFGNLSDKLSSGIDSLLSNNAQETTQPANQSSYKYSPLSSSSNSSSSSQSSGTQSSSGSNSSSQSSARYNDSINVEKQLELAKLNAELNNEHDLNKKKVLKKRIEDLIHNLKSNNSSSYSYGHSSSSSSGSSGSSASSSSRSHRHKKSRRSSSSSRSNDRYTTLSSSSSSRQYGGVSTGALSADASVSRFITFMEKYIQENPNDKRTIMRNVLTLFKGGHFKKPDSARIKTLCKNADADGKNITLKTNSNNIHLKKYNDNWLEMRHKYMKSVNELVDILENRILITNQKTQKLDVRNLSSRDLLDLETKTRSVLTELYSNAHQYYVIGVNALYDYYHNLTSGVPAY